MTDTDTPTAAGPTASAHTALHAWLSRAIGGAGRVAVGPPGGSAEPRLHMWPVALLSDQPTRGGGGAPQLRMRARYAVAPDGPLDDALRLLDLVLSAVAAQDTVQLVIEPASGAVRPAPAAVTLTIQLDVPVRIAPARPVAARVTGGLRLGGSTLYEINGRLVGPGDVPLADMTVAESVTGSSTVSGAGGEFRLPALPAGRSIVLHISGRGLHMQVEVPPETTDLVVIHCNLEEV